MKENIIVDWAFWITILAFVAAWVEMRWRVHHHGKILNGLTLTAIQKNLATLNEKADTSAEDFRWLREAGTKETDKREAGDRHIHQRLDEMK